MLHSNWQWFTINSQQIQKCTVCDNSNITIDCNMKNGEHDIKPIGSLWEIGNIWLASWECSTELNRIPGGRDVTLPTCNQ